MIQPANASQTKSTSDSTEFAWDIARLYPPQGQWSIEDYLTLQTNHLVEFNNGTIEVLTMPTELHQMILKLLFRQLDRFVEQEEAGTVLFAPLKVQVSPTRCREPDLVFLLARNSHKRGSRVWEGADLVMEILSEDDPDRDLVTKRREYAEAGISEYWIIDPRDQTILVLVLDSQTNTYQEHQRAGMTESVSSVLLPGFKVAVSEAFAD